MLHEQSSVRVTELSRNMGVSESTIRRDIADLAREGRLKKVHGGAVPADTEGERKGERKAERKGERKAERKGELKAERKVNVLRTDLETRSWLQADEKTKVAAFAASLIEDGELVYIDAGTTTGSMIEHISCRDATYVTNGINHAMQLARKGLRTWMLSGLVKASTEAVIGHDAVRSLQKYHFDRCFIGTDGVDTESGLTTSDIEESMVKTEAIRRSVKTFVLADSSKFGLVASVTFAPLSGGTIITDKLPDETYRSQTEIIELNE
jgi:DeoR family fructose operon transcriptional repressor